MNHAASNRKGSAVSGLVLDIVLAVLIAAFCFVIGVVAGFDAGVKAHAKGTHVVNVLADGSEVVTEVKK